MHFYLNRKALGSNPNWDGLSSYKYHSGISRWNINHLSGFKAGSISQFLVSHSLRDTASTRPWTGIGQPGRSKGCPSGKSLSTGNFFGEKHEDERLLTIHTIQRLISPVQPVKFLLSLLHLYIAESMLFSLIRLKGMRVPNLVRSWRELNEITHPMDKHAC